MKAKSSFGVNMLSLDKFSKTNIGPLTFSKVFRLLEHDALNTKHAWIAS